MSQYRMANTEPELEVHSNRSRSPLASSGKSSTLQSMLRRQASTMVELRKTTNTTEDVTPESSNVGSDRSNDSSSCSVTESIHQTDWHAVFHAAGHTNNDKAWSDSDDMSLPATSKGSDLHDSIEAIREEASRLDAAIALDQLDTLKNELQGLRKELHNRNTEIKDLRETIQAKDNRLSTLELERDLYRADAGCEESEGTAEQQPIEQSSDTHFVPLWSPSSTIETARTPDHKRHASSKTSAELQLQRPRASPPLSLPQPSVGSNEHVRSLPSTSSIGSSSYRAVGSSQAAAAHPSNAQSAHFVNPEDTPADQSNYQLQPATTKDMVPHCKTLQLYENGDVGSFHHMVGISETAASTGVLPPGQHQQTVDQAVCLPRGKSSFHIPPPRPATASACTSFNESSEVMTRKPAPTNRASQPRIIVPNPRRPAPEPRRLQYEDSVREEGSSVSSRPSASRSSSQSVARRKSSIEDDMSVDTSRSARSRSKKTESTAFPSSSDVGTKSCLPVPNPRAFLQRRKRNNGSKRSQQQSSRNQNQADELTQLLRTSLQTSEELRKRLAMISTYYETVLKSSDADRQNVEAGLLQQIAELKEAKELAERDQK